MWQELKNFLLRGDVLSLAVAVVIAGAFQKIIDSLVANVVVPILGIMTGGLNFAESFTFGSGEAQVKLGAFIQSIIDFMLVGTVLFFVIRAAGKKAE